MKYFPVLITTLTVQSAVVLSAPALAQRSQPPAAATVTAAFDPATLLRISWRRIRGLKGVLEPFAAHRLQGSAGPI